MLPCHLLWFHVPAGQPDGIGIANGRAWLVIIILLVWTFDIFSYLVGSWLGRHKLFPHISPQKSWEGLFGGITGLVVVFVALIKYLELTVTPLDYLAIPFLTGITALGGDVFESVLKRDSGVKDSSSLLPGHGGILDRFDAVFIAGPVLYWYFHFTRWFFLGAGV